MVLPFISYFVLKFVLINSLDGLSRITGRSLIISQRFDGHFAVVVETIVATEDLSTATLANLLLDDVFL